MRLDSLVFGIAGVCFGIIVGWVLGSQRGTNTPSPVTTTAAAPAPAPATPPPALIDEARVQSLMTIADGDPQNVTARVELGNLYYDAGRYDQAIPWYEAAVALNPRDANVSTDLGVCYYQTNQPDRALAQFERSLEADPAHAKTLLNKGIVLAFGKQDLAAATEAWRRVVEVAPGSEEAGIARRVLENLADAHTGLDEAAPSAEPGR